MLIFAKKYSNEFAYCMAHSQRAAKIFTTGERQGVASGGGCVVSRSPRTLPGVRRRVSRFYALRSVVVARQCVVPLLPESGAPSLDLALSSNHEFFFSASSASHSARTLLY